jgi:hypothetical protein
MSFSKFFNTVTEYLDPALDFLLGEKEYESGDVVGPRGGGFLSDLVGKGAKAYVAMTDSDDDREAFQAPEYKEPRIRRFTGRAPTSPGQTAAPQILGAADARVQRMLRNLPNRVYANQQMNRLGRDMRVAMNRRQGQRTIGLERPALPQVKEMAPAQVRKQAKDVK